MVIDDDGRVAYAYNLRDRKIEGHVWLYNRCETPDMPEWTDRSRMPFANPREYVKKEDVALPQTSEDFRVDWTTYGSTTVARIFVRNELWAILEPGTKPGWSRLARKRGPLATPLEEWRGPIG